MGWRSDWLARLEVNRNAAVERRKAEQAEREKAEKVGTKDRATEKEAKALRAALAGAFYEGALGDNRAIGRKREAQRAEASKRDHAAWLKTDIGRRVTRERKKTAQAAGGSR